MSERRFVINHPDLMKIWATRENEEIGLIPSNVTIGSGKKVYWRCEEYGHLFIRPIFKQASQNSECPDCKRLKSEERLIINHSILMKIWATKENKEIGLLPSDVIIGSSKKAYWRCEEYGHLFIRPICKQASRNSECPECKQLNQKYLSDYPEIVEEFAFDLNNVLPEDITAGSDLPVIWRCKKCNNTFKTAAYHRVKEKSECPYCSKKRVLKGYNDIDTKNPPNYKFWDYEKNNLLGLNASELGVSSRKKAWWFCNKNHSTFETISSVLNRKGNHCSECIRHKEMKSVKMVEEQQKKIKIMVDRKRLAINNKLPKKKERDEKKKSELPPSISKFWDNEENELHGFKIDTIRTQRKKIDTIRTQRKKIELPLSVSKFWDYEENELRGFKIETINMQRMYSFKCDKNHKWKSDIKRMHSTEMCPICYNELNSIAVKYPYLRDNFDVEKNGGILPEECRAVDNVYYWWTCEKGHSYVAVLKSVSQHKETGCMYCNKEKSYYSL